MTTYCLRTHNGFNNFSNRLILPKNFTRNAAERLAAEMTEDERTADMGGDELRCTYTVEAVEE